MDYRIWSQSELVRLIAILEEKLTQAYEEQGMTRSDAQGAVEAIILRAN